MHVEKFEKMKAAGCTACEINPKNEAVGPAVLQGM
jgi:hypothetical protein